MSKATRECPQNASYCERRSAPEKRRPRLCAARNTASIPVLLAPRAALFGAAQRSRNGRTLRTLPNFLKCFFLVGGLLTAGLAQAAQASCTLWIVHGLPEAGGVDARLQKLKLYLEKPMFGEWKKFALLDEKALQLSDNVPGKFTLPNGRLGTLTMLGVLEKEGKHRLRLRLTIEDGDKKSLDTVFVVDEGGVVLQAGQKHLTGKLIVGVSCDKAK